jgi:putative hemolysin
LEGTDHYFSTQEGVLYGMSAVSTRIKIDSGRGFPILQNEAYILASDSRYEVRIASSPTEIASALRLRHEVFGVELNALSASNSTLDLDMFDLRCKHLIAVERSTDRTIGTYRINSIDAGEGIDKFYSFDEFTIEDLPADILFNGVEIGRACIALDHRGTKALFLMWKGLANFLTGANKRYFFGCCSIFTRDRNVGVQAYRKLAKSGFLHEDFRVSPRDNAINVAVSEINSKAASLPPLFEMYLRLGARVCGPPMIDHDFGTIDFFTVFDLENMNEKYRRMFFRQNQAKTFSSNSNLKLLSINSTVDDLVP